MKYVRKLFGVLPLILTIIVYKCGFDNHNSWIHFSMDASFHFSLITVNAIFGGFLYTNYSLLIGLLDNSIIEKIKNTDIIRKRNEHIIRGIVYATISVLAGLYLVLILPGNLPISKSVYNFVQSIEVVYMIFLIIYFLLSLYEMSLLVKGIHSPDNAKTDEEIKLLKTQIRENAKRTNEN